MQKTYSRIVWKNYPSIDTPVNETNLNKIDYSLNEVDDRVIELDNTKTNLATSYTLIKEISFNENNGVFTITRLNGSTFTINTLLEKIAVNFRYDPNSQTLIIIHKDGTEVSVDLSALITQYEFVDTSTIAFHIQSDGKVSCDVKDGSITEAKLQPNYLATIKIYEAAAEKSKNDSLEYSLNSAESASQSLAYMRQAEADFQNAEELKNMAISKSSGVIFKLDTETGHLLYSTDNDSVRFTIDQYGHLKYTIYTSN